MRKMCNNPTITPSYAGRRNECEEAKKKQSQATQSKAKAVKRKTKGRWMIESLMAGTIVENALLLSISFEAQFSKR